MTPSITPREQEVLHYIGFGLTYTEVGQVLHISPETVRSHLRSAYKKLGAKNKMEAINELKYYQSTQSHETHRHICADARL